MKQYTFKSNTKIDVKLYDHKITINKKGIRNKFLQGLNGEKTIFIKNITAVEFKKPTIFTIGFLQFSIIGGIESRGGLKRAIYDENTIIFRNKEEYNQAKEIKEFIEVFISNGSDSNKKTSSADEIYKLKDLLDSGYITTEEFVKYKNKILENY